MAFVTNVVEDEREFRSKQPTDVTCYYMKGDWNGEPVIQLNSYGSSDRQIEGKLSQTLQFNERSARELYDALRRVFRFE